MWCVSTCFLHDQKHRLKKTQTSHGHIWDDGLLKTIFSSFFVWMLSGPMVLASILAKKDFQGYYWFHFFCFGQYISWPTPKTGNFSCVNTTFKDESIPKMVYLMLKMKIVVTSCLDSYCIAFYSVLVQRPRACCFLTRVWTKVNVTGSLMLYRNMAWHQHSGRKALQKGQFNSIVAV